jgi:cell division protein FtsW
MGGALLGGFNQLAGGMPSSRNKAQSYGSERLPQNPDFPLLATCLALTMFGLVMVASSSAPLAYESFNKFEHLFIKQLISALIGIGLLVVLMKIDYRKLFELDGLIMIAALGVTFLTLIPQIAPQGLWIRVAGFSFQPTEFAKFAFLIFMAASLVRKVQGGEIQDFIRGVVPYFVLYGVLALVAISQPDFALVILFGAIVAFMLLLAGARLFHLLLPAMAAMPVVFFLILSSPYRRARLLTFLDPFADPSGAGYHLLQSLTALGSGGILGRGLGASREKWLYLPSAYNDFILSIVGEELGLIGVTLILVLFVYLAWRGFQIAMRAADSFGFMLAAGITFALVFQAAVNFGVTVGVLPVTGLTLPLVSYGGTSLIISLGMIGILLSISRYSKPLSQSGVSFS